MEQMRKVLAMDREKWVWKMASERGNLIFFPRSSINIVYHLLFLTLFNVKWVRGGYSLTCLVMKASNDAFE